MSTIFNHIYLYVIIHLYVHKRIKHFNFGHNFGVLNSFFLLFLICVNISILDKFVFGTTPKI